ncbi:MAG TPA: hypothetical protein VJ773_05535, partial [Gemmatimonadales bacterium]|nr:hypothetical protein [Gemmatimonadales bacterium]
MHLDDAQVARLVDGEPAAGGRWVHEHLAACAECRARFAQAERDAVLVDRELRALDHLPPAIGAPAVAERARR